jgi:thiol-disulfide isomerase/thioredoxin
MSKKDRNQDKRDLKALRRERELRRKKRLPIIFGSVLLGIAVIITSVVLSNVYDESKQEQKDLYSEQITVSEMEAKVKNNEDFFAYLYQPDCEHCKAVSPKLIPMAREMNKPLYPVNIFNRKEAWEKYDVPGTPTLIHFKDGKEVGRLVGEQADSTFEEFLKK